MSTIKETISAEIKIAMKARASVRLNALRLALNEIKKKEIDQRKDLSNEEIQKTLLKMKKQVEESLAQATQLNRTEMIQEQKDQLSVLEEFLPKSVSTDELRAIVQKTHQELVAANSLPAGGAGVGAMMKAVMKQAGPGANGKDIQNLVKEILN